MVLTVELFKTLNLETRRLQKPARARKKREARVKNSDKSNTHSNRLSRLTLINARPRIKSSGALIFSPGKRAPRQWNIAPSNPFGSQRVFTGPSFIFFIERFVSGFSRVTTQPRKLKHKDACNRQKELTNASLGVGGGLVAELALGRRGRRVLARGLEGGRGRAPVRAGRVYAAPPADLALEIRHRALVDVCEEQANQYCNLLTEPFLFGKLFPPPRISVDAVVLA